MNYTVLLLYPDYIGNYGEETYLAWVEADSVDLAKDLACEQVADDNEDVDPDDMAVLALFEGHLEDIK